MTSLLNKLRTQYSKSYDLKHYTGVFIYHGGKDYNLSYLWYCYFSIYHPYLKTKTGKPKLIRQPPVYDNVNRDNKTKEGRLKALKALKTNLEQLLDEGYTPYKEESETDIYSIGGCLDFGLKYKAEIKKSGKATNSDYKYRVGIFKKYLLNRGFLTNPINELNQIFINNFLESELIRTSSRNANNTRTALSAIFSELVKKGYADNNYFFTAEKFENEDPEKNKAYSPSQVKDILKFAFDNHFELWVYLSHVYFGLFRPKECLKIQIKDIDFELKMFDSKTKTGNFHKQIPNILFSEYYSKLDYSKFKDDYFSITKEGTPGEWKADPENKVSTFSSNFNRKIRIPFKLNSNYTVYSFRHAAIGKIFLESMNKYKDESNQVEKALSSVRDITAHQSNEAVKKYLRQIGYFKIKDWSDLL